MSILTVIFIAALALAWVAATYVPMTAPTKKVVAVVMVIVIVLWFLWMVGVIPGTVRVGR